MKLLNGILLFICICFSLNAQSQDTLEVEEEEVDTVIIVKDPVLLKKTVVINETGFNSFDDNSKFWIEVGASPLVMNYNITPCPACITYVDRVKSTTTPKVGYQINANLSYFINNIYLSLGIGYKSYRERYVFDSLDYKPRSNNQYNFLSIPIAVGYRVFHSNKIAIIPSVGLSIENLLSIKGQTASEANYGLAENITDVRKYYSFNYLGFVRLKGVFNVSETIGLGIEPHFTMDFQSIIQSKEPFQLERYIFGINGLLIVKL